nr:hypothetical protein [Tanacetum cinerariifolium]
MGLETLGFRVTLDFKDPQGLYGFRESSSFMYTGTPNGFHGFLGFMESSSSVTPYLGTHSGSESPRVQGLHRFRTKSNIILKKTIRQIFIKLHHDIHVGFLKDTHTRIHTIYMCEDIFGLAVSKGMPTDIDNQKVMLS